jgi:hypothetical protein
MSTAWRGGAGTEYEFTIEQNGYINQKFDRDTAFQADYGQWRAGWVPNSNRPTVHVWIVDMCAKEDPAKPSNQTTNSANVIPVQRALVNQGLLSPQFVNGRFDSVTRTAYQKWQQKLGYSGHDADGIPGMVSLTKLGAIGSFVVVA